MPLASKSDQVRLIGQKICSYVNVGCLCAEKGKPLCPGVKALALEVYDLAHQEEIKDRKQWNTVNKLAVATDAANGSRSIRPRKR